MGHGNVTCLSEALEAVPDELPTWRGPNEQSMALAAIAFAKAKKRRENRIATLPIGPAALTMVTAAGVAHANRVPDPVLQQVEHFHNPTTTVNDAYKAVIRRKRRIGDS
jgi:3D-(3,5/4)-trihydroxycyclohexane-1,2-dione acylhydrolase (decyclizing)